MSEGHVRFHLGGEVTIEAFSDALARFSQVLDALQETHSAEVRWVLAGLDYGSAAATAQAVPLDEVALQLIPIMYDNFIDAANRVHSGDADPGFPLHRQMYELMALADKDHPVTIQTKRRRLEVVAPIEPLTLMAGELLDEDPMSLGTVRGRVETLSRRRGLSFNLYELASNAAVKCYLDSELEETMRDIWGHIADVTGTVRRDAKTDRPLWIRGVRRVDPVEEGDPDSYLKARGAIQTSEPAEALVRQMRDDE